MDATLSSLPNDLEALRAIVVTRESALALRNAQLLEQQSTIAQLQHLNEALTYRLDLALRRIYGRSSEKIDPGQLLLFGQMMRQAAEAMEKLNPAGIG